MFEKHYLEETAEEPEPSENQVDAPGQAITPDNIRQGRVHDEDSS